MSSEKTSYSAVLGVVLSSLRRERGLEQGKMAQKMGLSQASYSRLESGKSSFSVNQMFGAANALGMPRHEFLLRLDKTIEYLEESNVEIFANPIVDKTNSEKQNSDVGQFVAGAALAAFVIGLISRE